MKNEIVPLPSSLDTAVSALEKLNTLSVRYGLSLTAAAQKRLLVREGEALSERGRVAFGGSILPKLVYAFCDSPYIGADDYEELLSELADAFYYFKNESGDTVTDDELIAFMRESFDECGGSIEYLVGTSLEALCHFPHLEDEFDDE